MQFIRNEDGTVTIEGEPEAVLEMTLELLRSSEHMRFDERDGTLVIAEQLRYRPRELTRNNTLVLDFIGRVSP